jgi:hypothetical protein
MANELNLNASLSFVKNAAQVQRNINSSLTVTGNSIVQAVQNIGTADETLALGDISTIGYVFFHNLDGTNYIQIGSDGALYPLKLKAGEWALLRWNAAAIHAKANTAACDLEYIVVSD